MRAVAADLQYLGLAAKIFDELLCELHDMKVLDGDLAPTIQNNHAFS